MDEIDRLKVRLYLSENRADYICAGCGAFDTGLCAVNDRGTSYCSEDCCERGYNSAAMQQHMRLAGLSAALSQEGE